ncbi:hypothetical protein HA466_0005810 [Hirschfeldia incana]|nr:hypothetical protein HA466_0005810 [Hirschfeldia incana]
MTCPTCGRNLAKRLLPTRSQNCTKTRWSRSLDFVLYTCARTRVYTPFDLNYEVLCLNQVWILCHDCGSNTNVLFHLIAHKCSSCGSYNNRQTQRGSDSHSCSSGVPQVVGSTVNFSTIVGFVPS